MTEVAVLGSGANGASIGADLSRQGHDVVLIDQWPAHVEAMRARGVRIGMPERIVEEPVRALHLCDVCTLLGLSMHEAAAIPAMRGLMLRSGEEALATGAAPGHPLLPIFGMSPDQIRGANRPVEALLDTLLAGFTLPHTTTTVLQDRQKGRHSEVDDLNGLVAAEAARRGHAAPVNAAIALLAHEIEKGASR